MEDKYLFGNRIYELRTQKGLTQKELGKLLGVSNKAVSKWETGAAKPRVDIINKLSQILGVNVSELLGEEEAVAEGRNDGQLQNYLNYFEAQSKKLEQRFKLTKAIIIAFAFGLLVLSVVDLIHELTKGNAVDYISLVASVICCSSYALIMLRLITKIYYSEGLSKAKRISRLYFYFGVATLIIEAIYLVNNIIGVKLAYGFEILYGEHITTAVIIICMIVLAVLYDRENKNILKINPLVFVYVLFALTGICIVLCDSDILLYAFLVLFAIRSAIVKFEWCEIAEKVNTDYREKPRVITKRYYVFVAAVSIIIVALLSTSTLAAPYIMYKTIYSDTPECLKQPIEEYRNYALTFKENEAQRIDFENISFLCPAEWEVEYYENDGYRCIKYRNEKNGNTMLVNSQENFNELVNVAPDDEDFSKMDKKSQQELVEYQIKQKKADRLFKKYFNMPIDMNIYQADYLIYRVDLRNVKWYQTEKLTAYCIALFIKNTTSSLCDKAEYFETENQRGFITFNNAGVGGQRRMCEVLLFKGDGMGNEKYYQFLFGFQNESEDEYAQTISKIINSVEFK